MIKILGQREGRPMIGFGLSRGNCERLLQGRPIFIDLKVMRGLDCKEDFNEATVLIFGGETEQTMQDELEQCLGKLPKPNLHDEEN